MCARIADFFGCIAITLPIFSNPIPPSLSLSLSLLFDRSGFVLRRYTEDFFVQNVKILIGLLTCSCALVAQFYPKKFPDNKPILILCVVSYMVLSVLLQWFTSTVEQDIILYTKETKISGGGGLKKPQITLSTDMPRFQDKYKVTINAVADTSEYPSFEREESITK